MDAGHEAARGLTEIEGFLFWEAHRRTAQSRAAEFASRLPGLSEGQKAEIEWWYVEDQIQLSRMMTRHITDHVTAVEDHHAKRYAQLRRSAYAATTLLTVMMFGLCSAMITGALG
ncbi:hypothetical protein SSP24_82430 [Streptomyces spinoverrucosus]|uniref:Uncharacterized protein n=1 Tax=Streptomyces spinoverrucosus TaxID=284043 RepID=A0A4Y3VWI3_9ACTN|nr:hypothetical protein [Streptomyces spinoverrucosus]GEC10588.1 hypothetical protein SSP24_82430 [Streptomyces spinoverrucosus]GHB99036.1 hypothetical protein GCM10010397_84160 [Streptomyces spinoverrucosus]